MQIGEHATINELLPQYISKF